MKYIIGKVFTLIAIIVLTMLLCYVTINTVNKIEGNKEVEETKQQEQPQPLVINSRVKQGTYKGVVLFEGQKDKHTEKIAYEGNIRIVFEGKQIRVFIGDAVASDVVEHF